MVLIGVPQKLILGPLLFQVYINDIVDVVPETNRFMFADDTTLNTKQKSRVALKIEYFMKINNLAQFFSQNDLTLNSDKIKFMTILTLQKQNKVRDLASVFGIGDEELGKQNQRSCWF